jgi:hypothetical protein
MKDASRLAGIALFLCIAGVLLLQGASGSRAQDERASIYNPDPRGLMLLHRWLESRGIKTLVQDEFGEEVAGGPDVLFLVPPPENASWLPKEVDAIVQKVKKGECDVLILCDPDRERQGNLRVWMDAVGIQCRAEDNPTEAMKTAFGKSLFPAFPESIAARTRGHLRIESDVSWWPLYQDEKGAPWIVQRSMGRGVVYVALTPSPFQNDGLMHADHAFLMKERFVQNKTVVFDESHHHSRRREVFHNALGRLGVKAGALAFLLLIPLSLLGMAPRPGDPPTRTEGIQQPATKQNVHALAALYVKAGVKASAQQENLDLTKVEQHEPRN